MAPSGPAVAPLPAEQPGSRVRLGREVSANVRRIAAVDPARDARAFVKVGDSITTDPGIDGAFGCFASAERAPVRLPGREALRRTVDWFDQLPLPGGRRPQGSTPPTSWNRDSWAARAGMASDWPLAAESDEGWGGATPLERELGELAPVKPRLAVYMLGSNDLFGSPWVASAEPAERLSVLLDYAQNVTRFVEWTAARGIVPVLTYPPPITGGKKESFWYSPTAAAVVRGVAVAKKLPTVDAYSPLEDFAVRAFTSGNRAARPAFFDGLHPASAPGGECDLSEAALAYGRNVRALATLDVLDKLRRVLVDGAESADAEPPSPAGAGSLESPWLVGGLPFAHAPRLAATRPSILSDYARCGGASGQAGAETFYRLELAAPTALRALAFPGQCGGGDCDMRGRLHLALFPDDGRRPSADRCLAAGQLLERPLPAGKYLLVLDAPSGSAGDGLGVVTVHGCLPGDALCAKP